MLLDMHNKVATDACLVFLKSNVHGFGLRLYLLACHF